MSFIDDPKTGYGTEGRRPVIYTNPLKTPNDASPASGVIPDGTGTFYVVDGNWAPELSLQAPTALSKPITIHRNSSFGTTIKIDNTDLDVPLNLNAGDAVGFKPINGVWVFQPALTVNVRHSLRGSAPTAASPASAVECDSARTTVDGSNGTQQTNTYRYDQAGWVNTGKNTLAAGNPTLSVRQYTNASIQKIFGWTTLAQVSAGIGAGSFTVSGGASIGQFANAFANRNLGQISTTKVVATAVPGDANQFAIPTSYVRQEITIVPGKNHSVYLMLLSDRLVLCDVWVCTFATGAPVKKVGTISGSNCGTTFCTAPNLSPDNEYCQYNGRMAWHSIDIPKALVDSYSSGSRLKIAYVAADGNADNGLVYFNGFANSECLKWHHYVSTAALSSRPCGGGADIPLGTQVQSMQNCSLAAGTSYSKVRIPVTDTATDAIMALIGVCDSNGGSASPIKAVIEHSSGNVDLGRGKVHVKSPIVENTLATSGSGVQNIGWRLSAATLAAKTVIPTNSGIPYLEVTLTNMNATSSAALYGIVIEEV